MKTVNKIKRILVISFLILSTQLPGCNSDFTEKVKKSGIDVTRNGIKVNVTYLPPKFFALREMKNDSSVSLERAMDKFRNSMYFVVSIRQEDGTSKGSYLLTKDGQSGFKENVLKNNYNREKDMFLYRDTDTIKTVGIHYERNWGIGNEDVFMLTFSRNKKSEKELKKYHLIIREIAPDIGTVDIEIKKLIK